MPESGAQVCGAFLMLKMGLLQTRGPRNCLVSWFPLLGKCKSATDTVPRGEQYEGCIREFKHTGQRLHCPLASLEHGNGLNKSGSLMISGSEIPMAAKSERLKTALAAREEVMLESPHLSLSLDLQQWLRCNPAANCSFWEPSLA